MQLLTTLGIDWKLLIAQLINFTILLIVLSYFVYKPLLRVIDDRRERVKKSVEEAKLVEQRVRDMEKERQEQKKAIDRDAKAFLDEAKENAEKAKKEILDSTQKEVDAMLAKGREQLAEERKKLLADVQGVVTKISVRLAEKILEREFKADDQERILSSIKKDLPSLIS